MSEISSLFRSLFLLWFLPGFVLASGPQAGWRSERQEGGGVGYHWFVEGFEEGVTIELLRLESEGGPVLVRTWPTGVVEGEGMDIGYEDASRGHVLMGRNERGDEVVLGPFLTPLPQLGEVRKRSADLAGGGMGARAQWSTRAAGVHAVSLSAVAGHLGIPAADLVREVEAGQWQLINRGTSLPMQVGGRRDLLLFHVPAPARPYFGEWWMELGRGVGRGLSVRDASVGSGEELGVGWETRWIEQDQVFVSTIPGDLERDFWLWTLMSAGHPQFGSITNSLPLGLDWVPGSDARLRVELMSNSELAHGMELRVNGVLVAVDSWQGKAWRTLEARLPATLLAATNRVVLTSVGTRGSGVYLNNLRIDVPVALSALNGPIHFEPIQSGNHRIRIPATADVVVWDITQPWEPARLTGYEDWVVGGMREIVMMAEAGRRYVVSAAELALPVGGVRGVSPSGIADPGQEWDSIVVAPQRFRVAAGEVVQTQLDSGLRSRLVLMEDLRDDLGSGQWEASLIRDYLKITRGWAVKPRYVTLVGDGTVDFRGQSGGVDQVIPPMVVQTSFGRVPSDAVLGDLDGDGLPEVVVGRLTVRSETEVLNWVAKRRLHEAQPSGSGVVLLADSPDVAGNFPLDSERLVPAFADGFAVQKVFNAGNDLAGTRSRLMDALRTYPGLLNYLGHGARDRLGSYLTISDVAQLPVTGGPPWVVAMTCGAAHFAIPGADCVGESLVRSTQGGAIAVWSSTGFSINSEVTRINEALGRMLVKAGPHARFGDVLLALWSDSRGTALGQDSFPLYNFLGDPTVRSAMVPSVAPFEVRLVGLPGGDLELRWDAPGTMRVEWTVDPVTGVWDLLDQSGTGALRVVPDRTVRFFRLVR